MPGSIKLKLILFNLLAFSLLMAMAGSFLYFRIEESVLGSIDGHLHSEIQLIAALFEEEDGYFEVELSEANVGEFSAPLSGHYYQVFSKEGDLIARSPSLSIPNVFLPELESNLSAASYVIITGPGGKKLRMVSQVFKTHTGILKIEAAESMEEGDLLLHSLMINTLLGFWGASLLSIPCIWFLTAASLEKLRYLSQKMSEVTENNLNEIVEYKDLDRELMPLAKSFNGLLVRLERAFTRQRDFLSNASHDLRTPVSVMKTTCEVTLGKERAPSEYKHALNGILRAVKEMALTIDKILTASRLDSDTFSPGKSRVDLKALVNEIIQFLKPGALVREVSLSAVPADISVENDGEMLREALLNIVENGIKYNRRGGIVKVEVEYGYDGAVITVSDTGIGIPENEFENIFLRYYRVEQSEIQEKGTGLGLSIARNLILKCGGNISVESGEGRGTKFIIAVPFRI